MTLKLKRLPIFGEGIFSRSAVVTRQRRLNCYLEIRKDEDKSSIVCYGTPGLQLAFNASSMNYPARGMVGNDSALFEVSGSQILNLSPTGGILNSGTIGTSSGLVGMALNPTQLIVVDGSTGYVYNPKTGVITAPTGFPNGARTVAYCNGFFICELPGTNQFFVSALNDGTSWPGLSFAAAVQAIDGIAAIDTVGGLLIIFTYGHLEFWQNVGSNPEPFQYITNSATMYGIEAIYSRVHVGDSLLFLCHTGGGSFQNSSGSFQIARIRGYTVEIVSTSDIDNILQTMARTSTITDCTAFSFQVDEHAFAQFNFPTANRSLLFDSKTNLWSEVQSGITPLYAARHLGNLAAQGFKQTFIADYSNGNVYQFNPQVYTDNGNTILREVVTKTNVQDFNTFRVGAFLLDMETGVGLSSYGPGYNPKVSIECARDNRDFGAPRLFDLGKQGAYWTRIISRRWGRGKQMTFRVRMTSPVNFVITAAAAMTRQKSNRPASQRAKIDVY
jgi:hypothetical protein